MVGYFFGDEINISVLNNTLCGCKIVLSTDVSNDVHSNWFLVFPDAGFIYGHIMSTNAMATDIARPSIYMILACLAPSIKG